MTKVNTIPLSKRKILDIKKKANLLKKIKTDNELDVLKFIIGCLFNHYKLQKDFETIKKFAKQIFLELRKDSNIRIEITPINNDEEISWRGTYKIVTKLDPRVRVNILYGFGARTYYEYVKILNFKLSKKNKQEKQKPLIAA